MSQNFKYSFGGDPVPELNAEEKEFEKAFEDFLDAKKELGRAKSAVPSYTAQWSEVDYYADELAQYNLSVKKLFKILKNKAN